MKLKLHAIAYWFNLAFRSDENFRDKRRGVKTFFDLLDKRNFCQDLTKTFSETGIYQEWRESFGHPSALNVSKTIRPGKH